MSQSERARELVREPMTPLRRRLMVRSKEFIADGPALQARLQQIRTGM
jgi:hypothetical protein